MSEFPKSIRIESWLFKHQSVFIVFRLQVGIVDNPSILNLLFHDYRDILYVHSHCKNNLSVKAFWVVVALLTSIDTSIFANFEIRLFFPYTQVCNRWQIFQLVVLSRWISCQSVISMVLQLSCVSVGFILKWYHPK